MTRDPSDPSKSWKRLTLNTFMKKQKFQKLSFLRLRNTFYDKNDTPSQKKVIKNVAMFFNHWKGSWYWGIGTSVQLPLTFRVYSKVLWCSGEVRKEVKILKNFFSKSLCTWSIITKNTLHLVPEQRRTTRQQKLKIFQVLYKYHIVVWLNLRISPSICTFPTPYKLKNSPFKRLLQWRQQLHCWNGSKKFKGHFGLKCEC